MIKWITVDGNLVNSVESLIKKKPWLKVFDEMSLNFYLTGSFYFRTHTVDSDVDLFININSPNIEKILVEQGFKCLTTAEMKYYVDSNTASVYRSAKFNCDVQLVNNPELKSLIQMKHYKILKSVSRIGKLERRQFWDLLYTFENSLQFPVKLGTDTVTNKESLVNYLKYYNLTLNTKPVIWPCEHVSRIWVDKADGYKGRMIRLGDKNGTLLGYVTWDYFGPDEMVLDRTNEMFA